MDEKPRNQMNRLLTLQRRNRRSRMTIQLPTASWRKSRLKAQVAELQKRIQELEAEQKAAASKARARN